jgi:hypothetical protein
MSHLHPQETIARPAAICQFVMFGYPAAFANGSLFIGLHQNDFIMRLSGEDRTRFSAKYGERIFEPMKGRLMREYVRLPEELLTDARMLFRAEQFTNVRSPCRKSAHRESSQSRARCHGL